jgi:multidrug efflux pump subunit AcrB
VRLRPLLMTTLTAVFGTLPLAMGIGEGSELMQPLAIALVGGLITSTLLTPFVAPGPYVVMQGGGDRVKERVTGKKVREVPEAAPAAGD